MKSFPRLGEVVIGRTERKRKTKMKTKIADNADVVNNFPKGFIQDPNIPPIRWDNKNGESKSPFSSLANPIDPVLTNFIGYFETLTRFSTGSYTIAGYRGEGTIIWFEGNVTKVHAKNWLILNHKKIPNELEVWS